MGNKQNSETKDSKSNNTSPKKDLKNENIKENKIEEEPSFRKNSNAPNDFSLWHDIREHYKFGQVIGSGGFAEVRLCKRRNDMTKKFFAVKSIFKPQVSEENLTYLINEVKLLTSLDHPNIIKFYESYQDEFFFHLIMEYCSGGELFDRIVKYKTFKENDIAKIIKTLLSAISYCHSKGIIHRDIKPENILLECNGNDYEGIKLIDFGLSKKFEKNKKLSTIVGTSYYLAPEVLKGSYDEKCDVWAIGIIAYVLCSGVLPFCDKEENESKNF